MGQQKPRQLPGGGAIGAGPTQLSRIFPAGCGVADGGLEARTACAKAQGLALFQEWPTIGGWNLWLSNIREEFLACVLRY